MWRSPSDDGAWEPDESPGTGAPDPTGPFRHVEPNGRALTDRARRRAADRAAIERLAHEIYKSLAEYGRNLKYERKRDE